MDERIGLRLAGARVDLRRHRWLAEGLSVSPVLWRHQVGSDLSVERGSDEAIEGVGVRVAGTHWGVDLSVELRSGGTAVLAYRAPLGSVEERVRVRSLDAWDSLLDAAVQRASRLKVRRAQLLATSCTTGWLDWVHGKLWLLPDSLVRVRGGFVHTVVNAIASGLPERTATSVIGYDPVVILGGHRTNKVIPFDGIAHARLHLGLTTSGLDVTMTDGIRHRLLWLSSEQARGVLADRLLPVLGSRLRR
ncbi:hypothetical protein [Streptomyces sp. NPDC048606]|uniref:hypothetical protein n=1 Tax=Streptomyces sp. NPDC048606 TaxID=3154726 RepID=UPI003427F02F